MSFNELKQNEDADPLYKMANENKNPIFQLGTSNFSFSTPQTKTNESEYVRKAELNLKKHQTDLRWTKLENLLRFQTNPFC